MYQKSEPDSSLLNLWSICSERKMSTIYHPHERPCGSGFMLRRRNDLGGGDRLRSTAPMMLRLRYTRMFARACDGRRTQSDGSGVRARCDPKSATDDAVRDVARVMLWVFTGEADYGRGAQPAEATFKGALAALRFCPCILRAGRAERQRGTCALERYRAFVIDIKDKDLPTEAVNDLDRVRSLLERLQSKPGR